uniref:Nucleoporin Nup133/Nup155-like C-terminal domain-containing protein n=1 Tax=Strigamia maritima TaxID=126957 RepID=T1J954_STRMM
MFPSRTPQTKGKSSQFFSPAGREGSPFPLSRPAGGSRQKSMHSSLVILEEIPSHVVENFGTPLPVLVTEALTIQDRISEMSVKLSESGWAWLVCGRRLFIWRFVQTSGPRHLSSQCRELTLPPSDLAHKADLVSVFLTSDASTPSAIAVSPEGHIRYWPNIAHEGSSVEITADLQGQECFSLTDCQPLGCILATTTSTLVMVSTAAVNGQISINCRQLKVPQGVLTGIGWRMTSFIFGSMPNQSAESKLIKVVVVNTDDKNKKILYVLTGSNLQKWFLSNHDSDKLLFEFDVDRMVKENFIDIMWNRDIYHVNQIQSWLIDMQLTEGGVCLAAAATNSHVSSQLCYSFATLDLGGSDAPTTFSKFVISKLIQRYHESDEELNFLSYQFLLSSRNKGTAYMYLDKIVYCISTVSPNEEPDKVEFRSAADRILGAGTFDGRVLTSSSIREDDSPNSSTISFRFSRQDQEIGKEDKVVQFKDAFLLHCKRNLVESQAVLDSLFPSSSADAEFLLNMLVANVSKDIIDDYPASDPRWAEAVPFDSMSSTSSLIILRQLEDKQRAHLVFIAFLKESGLWNKFSTTTIEQDVLIPTRLLLREHAEKIVASLALRNLHLQHDSLIEQAIKIVLQKRNINVKGKLTHQDLFYREVSKVQDIVPALIECEDDSQADITGQDVKRIMAVNTIFQAVFQDAWEYQHQKVTIYQIPPGEPDTEYIPWMASTGNGGIRNLLIKQFEKTTNIIAQGVEDVQTQGLLYQQLVNLADIVLNGYCVQLESVGNTGDGEHYGLVLQQVIVVEAEEYDRTAVLAEKYCDFGILIQLCELTNNQERLQRYMNQFADKNFSEYVFKWYLKEGKRGKLLTQPVTQHVELENFLKQHRNLSWLHNIKIRKYTDAQETLQELALNEKDNLAKKKTLLSLSKLTTLVSDQDKKLKDIKIAALNREQELILHQENLPSVVVENFGYDSDNMKVMTPKELIELYICDGNANSNEYDFKKALDLLQFIDKNLSSAGIEALKVQIWCAAILKDRWYDLDMNKPLDSCEQTIFFKIVDLILFEGLDLNSFIAPLDDILNADELGDLRDSQEFRFFIQAGYEKLKKQSYND